MIDLVQKALAANRESRSIEFKKGFDTKLLGDWCEIIKDCVAIANSGGGVIVFGLDDQGNAVGENVELIAQLDPADISDKVAKYIGLLELRIEIQVAEKNGHKLVVFIIEPAELPIIFEKPGNYEISPGKQKTAFGVGTVYFRRGAKSDPASNHEIRKIFDRRVEQVKKSWLANVRKVVEAPEGAQVELVAPVNQRKKLTPLTRVSVVNDPKAKTVALTRDLAKATGTLLHEQVSEQIFEEINNVIDANKILAGGQNRFFLGLPVYFRIYAERIKVVQDSHNMNLLLKLRKVEKRR